MRNIKFVAGFAICGFILSFVFGLFSHSGFLLILLKALICSVVFAGLGFGIDFLFTSFLLDENSNDISVDSAGTSRNSGNSGSDGNRGKVVDLVVQDEELGNGDSGNSFIVGNNRQMLNPNDIKSESNSVSQEGGNSGFVPLRKFETVNNISGTESENPDIIKASDTINSGNANSSGDGELDVLPDMSYMASESQDNEGSVIDGGGSAFSDSPVSSMSNSSSKADEIVGKMKDTALIAKAISSVLSDEDSL